MKKSIFFLTALFLLASLLQSCKKDNADLALGAERVTAEDLVAASDLSEIADAEIDEYIPNSFLVGAAEERGGCAEVSFQEPRGVWPNVITIDYGTGCTQPGGITFKGKIIVNQSNRMDVVGATRVVSYENFFIENAQVTGGRTLTNVGPNASGQPTWTKIGAETIIFPDGSQASRNINHVRTQTEGFDTPDLRPDNVWQVTINDNGTNRNGNAFSAVTTSPLVRRFTCPWIVSGILELSVNDSTRSLDFGDGSCENDATLTRADGSTRDIKIRRRWWRN
jgi:hypothetical protein